MNVFIQWIIPILAFFISVISLIFSLKSQRLQNKVNEHEIKIKEYEIDKIEKEKEEENKSYIEARVIKVNSNNYKLRISNIGKKKAFNITIDSSIEKPPIFDTGLLPYEELAPQTSFDLILIRNLSQIPKFTVALEWESENGEKHTNKFFCNF